MRPRRPATLLLAASLAGGLVGCKREAPASPAEPAPVPALEDARAPRLAPAEARALAAQATQAAERAALDAHRQMGQAPSAADVAASQARLAHLQERMQRAIRDAVEPVPAGELQAALPEALAGFERTSGAGQTTGRGPSAVSVGIASFEAGAKRVHMEVTDTGAMKAFAAVSATGWQGVDIDRATAGGYERTGTFQGHRSFARLERDGPRARLRVLVAGRFMLEVEGVGVSMEAVEAAAKAVDIAGLAAKKDYGRKTVTPPQ